MRRASAEVRMHGLRGAAASMAGAVSAGGADAVDLAEIRFRTHAALGDWPSASADAAQMQAGYRTQGDFSEGFRKLYTQTHAMPLLAYALAREGDFAKAHAVIDATPSDCYECVRTRGEIDALEKNWNGAAYWFARAVDRAPSVPFVYADWGAMLMANGDLDGAIAKFGAAHEKGPHFADPIAMWGEALIAKNRSDLALAKFEEASRYAPNWARLHLKWGEALLWSGDKAGAAKEFALAAGLDLSGAERAELARVRG
jgi:tetratricopeptide (TPR) repeat protein